ncbi:MAG: hypothetical protein AMS14_07975 [Planctomycetes bacterium DG_20]|nr:MAG: hypothetical protein AMS14_07975 [Planctomycetes bacterium DG_20]
MRKTWGTRFFLVSAALFAIVALVGAQYMPLKYTGTAVFHRHTDPAAEERAGSFETIKLTLEHELGGREAVKRAAEELGLTRGLKQGADGSLTPDGQKAFQELVQKLMENIQIKWPVRSEQVDLISVSFTHDTPDLAQSMPDTLVRNYIDQVSGEMVSRLDKSHKFLQERVGEVDTRLGLAVKRRVEFETQHAGKLPRDPGVFDREMREISADIDTVRRQQEVAVQQRERLKEIAEAAKANPDAPSQVVKGLNPKLGELKKDLSKYERILDDQFVLKGMTERDPIIQRLRKRIGEIKKEIEETPEEAVLQTVFSKNSSAAEELAVALAGVQSQVDLATRELDRLQKRHREIQTLLADYAPTRQQYLDIIRKCDELEGEKANWQIRLTEVRMALSAEAARQRTHLETVQLAERQFLPESPKLSHVLGFALIGGLAFGGLLVFIHNVVNRSIAKTFVFLARVLDPSALPLGVSAFGHSEAPGDAAEAETRSDRMRRIVWRFVLQPAIAVILVALLAAAILNITLWLNYPDQYEQWKTDPTAYVSERVHAGIVERLRERWEAA